jgi:GT2 family glycosyltransferase
MTSDPRVCVSVCIANFNGIEVIDDCLRSVLEQTGNLPIEILMHDDASTDGSVDHIRRHYPQVMLIRSATNVGFCIANNRMASAAKGEYLLLLNNDATLFPDALHALLKEAEQCAKAAILTVPQYDADSGALVDRGCLLDPFYNPVPNQNPEREDVAMVIGACLWVPRSLWLELGGFPDWFGSIAEDMYLCCRARLAGYDVRVLKGSGYRHWQGRSFGGSKLVENRLSSTYRRRALSERNKTFVMVLTCPTYWLWLLMSVHLSLLLVEGLLLCVAKREWRIFREVYWVVPISLWRERERWSVLRKCIQQHRQISFFSYLRPIDWRLRKLHLLLRHGMPNLT